MRRKKMNRYARRFNRLSRREKRSHPLVSKKDVRRNTDAMRYGEKMEIARELGLLDEVKRRGWSGLSAAQTGRIGGRLSGRGRRRKLLLSIEDDDDR